MGEARAREAHVRVKAEPVCTRTILRQVCLWLLFTSHLECMKGWDTRGWEGGVPPPFRGLPHPTPCREQRREDMMYNKLVTSQHAD